MQERRVTVDVHTHELARPFVVLATQNPVEYEGTYPLPEAQVDRFMMRLSLGYPDAGRRGGDARRANERGDRVDDARGRSATPPPSSPRRTPRAACTPPTRCARYVVALLGRTRDDPRVELGASPRAGLLLLRAAKARALLAGRDHVLPDDVQALARAVLAHRLVLAPEAVDVSRRRSSPTRSPRRRRGERGMDASLARSGRGGRSRRRADPARAACSTPSRSTSRDRARRRSPLIAVAWVRGGRARPRSGAR